MWSRRLVRALLSLRLLAIYSLGTTVVSVPLTGFDLPGGSGETLARPIAAVVATGDGGYVLDRDGHVLRVSEDGSPPRLVASLDRHSTPFGAAVGDRVVFGGVRCEKGRCSVRVAEVVVLDGDGKVEAVVELRRASGALTAASALDGLALVGRDEGSLWFNSGGALFQVDVAAAHVVAEVPWLGGEPCVIDGVVYDLVASGGTYEDQGTDLASTAELRLRLHAWDGGRWRRVEGGATSMAYGQNAYCSPGGYEIRDGRGALARWSRGTGWQRLAGVAQPGRPQPGWLGPLTTSTGSRYAVMADGSVVGITGARPARQGPLRRTGVVIPELMSSDSPPAVQLDDAGGRLFWCATTYRLGAGTTRCGGAGWASSGSGAGADAASRGAGSGTDVGTERWAAPAAETQAGPPPVHHYNLCSSACGGGARPHSLDVVAWLVARHRPVALSLNEMCYDDSVQLTARVPSGFDAGASYVALGTTTGCPGAIKQFGNQIRVSGGSGAAWWAQLPTQVTTPCDHRIQECRGLACAEANVGSDESLVFCTAHLETPRRDPDVPGRQVQEYLENVTDHYGRRPESLTVLAGDFNVEPAHTDALLTPEGYRQAATGPTVNGHRPPASKQIDMVYYRDPNPAALSAARGALAAAPAPATPAGTTYCDIQASDHCYVMASRSLT